MKELIKFELYKIFSKKSVLVLLLICIITSISSTITDYLDIREKGLESYDNIKKIGQEYEGTTITEKSKEELEKKGNDARIRYNNRENITDKEKVITYGIYDYFIGLKSEYEHMIGGRFYKVKDIKNELSRLEKDGESNTYNYKELKYVYDLENKKEIPKYHFKFGWREATEFNMKPLWIAILIIVAISTIFSNEYQSNTASIVLSSKNGQRKLTWAKVVAGLLFSTFTFIIVNGIQVIILAMHGFEGWNVPMSFLSNCVRTPYTINIGTFFITGLLVSFIGVILFTLLIMLISLISKSNIISFAISVAILLGPEFLARFMPTYNLTKIFMELNIENLMGPIMMFGATSTYNIFGKPTLYLNVIVTIGIISIPIILYLINKFGKKQVV